LDILAVPFFSILFLVLHRKTDMGLLGLRFRDYDEEVVVMNGVGEKPAQGPVFERSGEDVAHNHGAAEAPATTTVATADVGTGTNGGANNAA
jgi:hypothetical protein